MAVSFAISSGLTHFGHIACSPAVPSLPTIVSSAVPPPSSRLFSYPSSLLRDGLRTHILKLIIKMFIFSLNLLNDSARFGNSWHVLFMCPREGLKPLSWFESLVSRGRISLELDCPQHRCPWRSLNWLWKQTSLKLDSDLVSPGVSHLHWLIFWLFLYKMETFGKD